MANFSVQVRDYEPFEKALRRFTSLTRRSGVLRTLKKKRFYTKPSVQKKIDQQKGIRRRKKAERLAAMTQAERRKETQARKGGRRGGARRVS
jgi:small subunit ribosomal protein S21